MHTRQSKSVKKNKKDENKNQKKINNNNGDSDNDIYDDNDDNDDNDNNDDNDDNDDNSVNNDTDEEYNIENEEESEDEESEDEESEKDEEKSDESEEYENNNYKSSVNHIINNEEYEDEYDEDDDNVIKQNIILILKNNNKRGRIIDDKDEKEHKCGKKKKYSEVMSKYSHEEKKYFNNLSEHEKERIYLKELELIQYNESISMPNRFKFLEYDIVESVKTALLYHVEQLNSMCSSSSEYFKLNNWITTLSKIPIGKYRKIEVSSDDDVCEYLKKIKYNIDNNIFGHNETKEQIIRILAQWISNPEKTGYVIGIKGPPGVGKTKLVKECICKAMNFPLAFVSLGGIDDSSYLSGFNYTYEGSRYGKILECLIKAGVMNPVFLFDELDKVSATSRGDEIINTLIHLTDPIQNEKYTDKYFQEIDLDLSKSIIIFTYNNEEYINPILKDRMITINVNGYTAKEKLIIAKEYLIDEILPKFNMKKGDIIFDDNLLEYIISTSSSHEQGVRSLKRCINNIISWINMMRYIKTDNIEIKLPYKVSIGYYDKYCKKNIDNNTDTKLHSMYL